jgi:hypothetical protein
MLESVQLSTDSSMSPTLFLTGAGVLKWLSSRRGDQALERTLLPAGSSLPMATSSTPRAPSEEPPRVSAPDQQTEAETSHRAMDLAAEPASGTGAEEAGRAAYTVLVHTSAEVNAGTSGEVLLEIIGSWCAAALLRCTRAVSAAITPCTDLHAAHADTSQQRVLAKD